MQFLFEEVTFQSPDFLTSILTRDLFTEFLVEVGGTDRAAFTNNSMTILQGQATNCKGCARKHIVVFGYNYRIDVGWCESWCREILALDFIFNCLFRHFYTPLEARIFVVIQQGA